MKNNNNLITNEESPMISPRSLHQRSQALTTSNELAQVSTPVVTPEDIHSSSPEALDTIESDMESSSQTATPATANKKKKNLKEYMGLGSNALQTEAEVQQSPPKAKFDFSLIFPRRKGSVTKPSDTGNNLSPRTKRQGVRLEHTPLEEANKAVTSKSYAVSFNQEEIEILTKFLEFQIPVPVKDKIETAQKSDNKTLLSPHQLFKRQVSSGFKSDQFDKMLPALKGLLLYAIKRGIFEIILCTLIMRDIYSLLKDGKNPDSNAANQYASDANKTKIIALAKIVYGQFIVAGSPFEVNFSDEDRTHIIQQWQAAFYPAPVINEKGLTVEQPAQIPALELVFNALNGLIRETNLRIEIKTALNATEQKSVQVVDPQNALKGGKKAQLNKLFDILSEQGCPRKCATLFSTLETILMLNDSEAAHHFAL